MSFALPLQVRNLGDVDVEITNKFIDGIYLAGETFVSSPHFLVGDFQRHQTVIAVIGFGAVDAATYLTVCAEKSQLFGGMQQARVSDRRF